MIITYDKCNVNFLTRQTNTPNVVIVSYFCCLKCPPQSKSVGFFPCQPPTEKQFFDQFHIIFLQINCMKILYEYENNFLLKLFLIFWKIKMESSGFEPEAPALQGRCSTVELQPHSQSVKLLKSVAKIK